MPLMRATIAIITALALAAGAGAGAVAATAGTHHHPRLTLRQASPVSVRGHGFHARERVRLVLRTGGQRAVRHVRASRHGSFSATFPGSQVRPCGRYSVTAWGPHSGRVVLQRAHVMQPDCVAQ